MLSNLGAERRRRLLRRALPALAGVVVLVIAAAWLFGALVRAVTDSPEERTAKRFAAAWQRADFPAMHAQLTPEARAATPPEALAEAYRAAAATATATRVEPGAVEEEDGAVRLPVTVATRIFGPVRGTVVLPMEQGLVAWAPHLAFPELRPGEALNRRTSVPRRGRILARDGSPIAAGQGRDRRSPLVAGAEVAGELEPARDDAERERVYAQGFDREERIGLSGLERVFQAELAGTPGGVLLAGGRELARSRPRPGRSVTTTIDLEVQSAASLALGGRFGGIAAIDARTAEVRALAGIAFSAPQPPGSTFKLITTTAALEAGVVKPSTRFPVQTRAVIDGVNLNNAGGESCGGSFTNSFAHSCNSVFAPLGVKVGARRLVDAAERYGFNRPPAIAGAAPSTMPTAERVGSKLALGATAIGQGKVLATPLQLASVTQTIAAGGVRTEPTLRARDPRRPRPVRVTSRRVARTIARLMRAVVVYGTGEQAAIPGVPVAGKTGTAELGRGVPDNAWFTGYAPAGRGRLVAAALFVQAGAAGGDVAAPAVRTVLQAGLTRSRP